MVQMIYFDDDIRDKVYFLDFKQVCYFGAEKVSMFVAGEGAAKDYMQLTFSFAEHPDIVAHVSDETYKKIMTKIQTFSTDIYP